MTTAIALAVVLALGLATYTSFKRWLESWEVGKSEKEIHKHREKIVKTVTLIVLSVVILIGGFLMFISLAKEINWDNWGFQK